MLLLAITITRKRTDASTSISDWIGRRQRELSDRVHAVGDYFASQHGWQVTTSTGRLGFGARSYRDPRFEYRRRHRSTNATPASDSDHCPCEPRASGGRAVRIAGRRSVRRDSRRQRRAHSTASGGTESQLQQTIRRQPAECDHQAQREENHLANPAKHGKSRTSRILELDQALAGVILAALDDAAALRREVISSCPDCRASDERLCTDHEGS